MKTLIIIRHAKAEQGSGKDIERKLTERGHRNAIQMAEKLKAGGYKIDKIFSSPSERTLQTTRHFAEVFGVMANHIRYFESLYLGDVLAISETICWLYQHENVHTLAIVGHNPGVTNFVNDLTHSTINSIPTSGIAVLRIDTDHWDHFATAPKSLEAVLSPKDEN
ncbi:phosphohistidine phosphatase SixA [Niabella ginsenosidivorans]|uniref:Phosphohistidine phosphatase SixA n=1 Tax=Niabella ginsenosidivorans TaxID=1176587 RepID=A0A1A9I5N5_9BACT|nr:phosphohistidine phosphatase SixA [Niabella ginsenosidivorans]ANH82926.1 phosphohistidine phosphatase SixA [Niabella ginsenosidivorans]